MPIVCVLWISLRCDRLEQPVKSTSARPLTADAIVKENARKRQAPSALGNSSLFEAAAKRRPGPNKHGPMVSAVLLPIEN